MKWIALLLLHFLIALSFFEVDAYLQPKTNHFQPQLSTTRNKYIYSNSFMALNGIRNPFRGNSDPSKLARKFQSNPLFRVISNLYSFFYWFPRNNVLYDVPWSLFKNSTTQFLAWYQIPHNLPPYRYFGEGYPADFFCFGLPGNTLPLGNWDPLGFSQVEKSVVFKYRESELKHGRIAMLAFVGCLTQEIWHPIHPAIGGLSITHMNQLKYIHTDPNVEGNMLSTYMEQKEYWLVIFLAMAVESWSYVKYWKQSKFSDYNHQFSRSIGLGNLDPNRECGDLKFDPLKLMPETKEDQIWIREIELNHSRLAMIAMLIVFAKEYLLGLPILSDFHGFENEIESILNSESSAKSLQELIDAKIRNSM